MLPLLAAGFVAGIGATVGTKFANDVLIPKIGRFMDEVKEAYEACKCDDCGCVNCECESDCCKEDEASSDK